MNSGNGFVEILVGWANGKDSHDRRVAAGSNHCPSEQLIKLAGDEDYKIRWAVAENLNCPATAFAKLAGDEEYTVRCYVALNPNCPVEILANLAGDKEIVIRRAVAKNLNCPDVLLKKLASEENDILDRIHAAQNKSCPMDMLDSFAGDIDYKVRLAVAENPNCPVEVLVKLAAPGNDFVVRRAVAGNPNCPSFLLTELASDGYFGRLSAAESVNCPKDVLAKLAVDNECEVRITIAKKQNLPAEVFIKQAEDEEPKVRYAVAKNLNCPAEVLVKLSGDKYHLIRCAVAENTSCPVELLAKLAKSKIESIRVAVADNLACPVELLEKLARDNNCNVRYAVADNPNCTVELVKIALNGNHGAPEKVKTSVRPLKLPKQLEPLRKRIESTVKPFIAMKDTAVGKLGSPFADDFICDYINGYCGKRTFSKQLRLWQSKVGGLPYLPKNHEYPTDPDGKPLSLLVQINFEDVPKLDMFPEKGILQIYLGDADDYLCGINYEDRTDQSYFRVLYFPEVIYDKDALITDFEFLPKDDYYIPLGAVPIEFDLKYEPISAPDYWFEQTVFGAREDKDDKLAKIYWEKFRGSGSKIGGYPDFVQSDPRDGEDGEDEFILLMQFDGGFDINAWGDGFGNFFIRKSDLQRRDFSKVLYDWGCM